MSRHALSIHNPRSWRQLGRRWRRLANSNWDRAPKGLCSSIYNWFVHDPAGVRNYQKCNFGYTYKPAGSGAYWFSFRNHGQRQRVALLFRHADTLDNK